MSSLLFLLAAVGTYLPIAHRTRDWFAPCGLLCLFWFAAAALADVASLKDLTLQQPWEFDSYIAIYMAGLSVFSVGWLMGRKRRISPITVEPSAVFRRALDVLIVLSLIAVATRLYMFGFSIEKLLLSFGGVDLKDELSDAIPGVHYFEILTPYLSLCAIFELSAAASLSTVRRRWLQAYVIYTVVLYCVILSASRGTLLIVLTGAMFLYVQNGKLRLTRIVMVVAGTIVLMSALSFARMSSDTVSNSFLGEQAFQIFLSPIYTYVAFNFENFNKLVRADLEPTYLFYSLKAFLWPLLKADYTADTMRLTNFDTLFFNARTFIYPFYHDLGLVGCLLYPSAIAVVLASLHNSLNRRPSNTIVLMALQKPVWFAFFGNYFFGELVIVIPLLALFLLGTLYGRRRRRRSSQRALANDTAHP
jgi:oligosaccharide repeat unit polymerase